MSENINLSVILAAGMGSRIDKLQMNKPTSKVLRTIQKTGVTVVVIRSVSK